MQRNFFVQIKDFIKKVEKRENEFLLEFAQDIAQKVVERTPVLTGFARASWYGGSGQNDEHPRQPIPSHVAGSVPSNFALLTAAIAANAKVGREIAILNNAKYIIGLEYGSSKKAPSGMVRVTMAEAQQIAEAVVARMGP